MNVERLFYSAEPLSLWKRLALLPLTWVSVLYLAGVRLRRWAYDSGWLHPVRIPGVTVVSVGNLVVGGAGKTPAVIAIADEALRRGHRVIVLSRGYGRKAREPRLISPADALPSAEDIGDEPRLIRTRLPGVWLGIGADRTALLQRARLEADVDVAILDDGFQHRRLARDIDLLVLPASNSFGNGHALPRGPLREPRSSLRRATHVWFREGERRSRGAGLPAELEGKPVLAAHYRVSGVRRGGEAEQPPSLQGQQVMVLTGIARPQGFVATVESLGATVLETFAFPDHHPFTSAELEAVRAKAQASGAVLVTTEKDWMRLPASLEVLVVVQTVEVAAPGLSALLSAVPPRGPPTA